MIDVTDKEPLGDARLAELIAKIEKVCALYQGEDDRDELAALRSLQRVRSEADRLRAEHAEREGWRPIETAPKDGTYIIAWCVHINAKYAKDAFKEGWCAPVITNWIDHNGGGFTWHGLAGTFTHWMPLPKPPAAIDASNTSDASRGTK